MVATSGNRLISEDALEALKHQLLPLATVATPNIPEAEILSGLTIRGPEDMVRAARVIGEIYGCTLSSAIAAGLAKGLSLEAAVGLAKEYLIGALSAILDLGHGSGPMDHMWDLKSRFLQGT